MAMNRVQFQPGLSMAEFMDRYGSDVDCSPIRRNCAGMLLNGSVAMTGTGAKVMCVLS